MPITVELQDVYSYNKTIFIIAAVIFALLLALAAAALLGFILKKTAGKTSKGKALPPKVRELSPWAKAAIKKKYLELLLRLENDYKAGKWQERKAYEELSLLSRRFVREMTGIKVTNYTLEEIKTLNIPKLSGAIDLCYPPEFSYKANSDFMSTISEARSLVETWN